MKAFSMDAENNITVCASAEAGSAVWFSEAARKSAPGIIPASSSSLSRETPDMCSTFRPGRAVINSCRRPGILIVVDREF